MNVSIYHHPAMMLSRVQREEITRSIVHLCMHSVFGFVLTGVIFVLTAQWYLPADIDLESELFFLFCTVNCY